MENDIGSIGPIRRIRQKPNLLYARSMTQSASSSLPSHAIDLDATPVPSSSVRKNHNVSGMYKEKGGNSIGGTPAVPSKSSEMASKILQTINIMASPREKTSPSKLTPSMLSGKALKSMEDLNSSQLLANVKDVKRLEGPSSALFPAVENTASQKLDSFEVNKLKKSVGPFDRMTSSQISTDKPDSAKEAASSVKSLDTATTSLVPPNQQKKKAFRMSAHEVSAYYDRASFLPSLLCALQTWISVSV